MKLPYMISGRSISVLLNGHMRQIASDNVNYEPLREALRQPEHDVDLIGELIDVSTFVAKATFGAVQISDGQVRWNGKPIANVIADRLMDMLKAGDDLEPLSLFLGRLMLNPVESARDELYLWLEAGNAPITPKGKFLAFKKVRKDYKDCHSGTFDNSVGKVCEMERSLVDTNRNNTCSRGLHFCQYEYLSCFGGERVMIVEIDPGDVVSIPSDYKNQKGRTWRYTVVGEVPKGEEAGYFNNVRVDDRHTAVAVVEPEPPKIVYPNFNDDNHVRCMITTDWLEAGKVYLVDRGNSGADILWVYPGTFSFDAQSISRDVNPLNFELVPPIVWGVGKIAQIIANPDEHFLTYGRGYLVQMIDQDGKLVVRDDDGCDINVSAKYFIEGGEVLVPTEEPYVEQDAGIDLSKLQIPDLSQSLNQALAAPNVLKDDRGGILMPAHPLPWSEVPASIGNPDADQMFYTKSGQAFTASQIKVTLDKAGSNNGAARELGVSRSTLQDWTARIKKFISGA